MSISSSVVSTLSTQSIAQSRQQLSALIAAAQHQPQAITNRNTPVAVLVSTAYFARSEAAIQPVVESLYSQVVQLRASFAPQDDSGFAAPTLLPAPPYSSWQRANAFADPS